MSHTKEDRLEIEAIARRMVTEAMRLQAARLECDTMPELARVTVDEEAKYRVNVYGGQTTALMLKVELSTGDTFEAYTRIGWVSGAIPSGPFETEGRVPVSCWYFLGDLWHVYFEAGDQSFEPKLLTRN